jgi:exosortase/archaeosortase family protein
VSVTSACSGLTLLQNLLWVAWWTVLLRHRGLVRRFLHALLAVPAVLIANTLRVLALAVGAAWYGEQILIGTAHVIIGWAAVVLAMLLFLAMEQAFPAHGGNDTAPS